MLPDDQLLEKNTQVCDQRPSAKDDPRGQLCSLKNTRARADSEERVRGAEISAQHSSLTEL